MVNPLIRSAALFLSFAFGVIGMGVGINALEKSNNLKSYVREHSPTGVNVNINTDEAFDPGAVVTVGCGLLALTSILTFLLTFFPTRMVKQRLLLPFIHFFWAVWILASLIGFDVVAVNKDAKITAFLGDTQLPDTIVQQQEKALGVSPTYWDHDYIKLFAILPWFTFLFGIVAGMVLLGDRKVKVSTAVEDTDEGVLRADTRELDGKSSEEKREIENA